MGDGATLTAMRGGDAFVVNDVFGRAVGGPLSTLQEHEIVLADPIHVEASYI